MSRVADGRARRAFAIGATLGLVLALGSLVKRDRGLVVPADAVAMVNGSPIRDADLERALTALAADRREPLGPAERRLVIERLVEEELLVQRANELGLDRSDRTLRARLVTAMVDAILADRTRAEPSVERVEAFYRENAALFAPPARLRVRDVEVRIGDGRTEEDARARALRAAARLRAGEEFGAVAGALGDRPVALLPDAPISPTQLREYLGPTVANAALRLAPGEVSDPVRGTEAFHVLQGVTREAGAAPPLTRVEETVREEMRRRTDAEALRAYLETLRERATIRMREQ